MGGQWGARRGGWRLRLRWLVMMAIGLAAAGCACLPEPVKEQSKEQADGRMQIEHATLANGMQVVVVPDHRAPVVTHSVWYRVGSLDEIKGDTGLSHMLEHLMFKGTAKHPYGELEKLVQRNGGVQNAFTSRDMTAYHQSVAKDKLPLMMELEADRMEGLVLTDQIFQPERSVVAEERKMRTDSNPVNRFFEKLQRAHFQRHPYGRPVIGWADDIQHYTFDKALMWYRQHYAPNNAILLVVGDTTLDEVMPLAEKTYGKVPARPVAPRTAHVEPLRDAPIRLVAVDKDVQVPVFYRMYRVPSAFQGVGGGHAGTQDSTALWVLSEIFGGSETARLYQDLVVERKLADGASADYDAVGAGEATFDLYVSPKGGVAADKIEAAVDAAVAKLVDGGVTQAELDKARTNLMAEEVYARDDGDSTMYRLGSWLLAGGTVETFDAWQAQLKALTVADLNRVARLYLTGRETTTGVLAGTPKMLGALKPVAPADLPQLMQ